MYIGKRACLLLTLLLCLFGCLSCGREEKSPDGILSELMVRCGDLPAGEIYRSGAAEGESGFLSPALSSALFGREAEQLLSRCEYALYLSSFAEPYEITVLRAESRTDARLLEELCLGRADELRVALRQTAFEPLGEQIRIVRKGEWVIMGIAADGDGFAEEVGRLLG